MSGLWIGAAFGLFVQVYSNGIRKLPLFTRPQDHVLAMAIGGLVGSGVHSWQQSQQVQLRRELEMLGKSQGPKTAL